MTRQAPGDGIEQVRGSVWLLAGALALVALVILLLVRPLLGTRPRAAADAAPAGAGAANQASHDDERRAGPAPPLPDARRARPVPRGAAAPPAPRQAPAAAPAAAGDPPAPADGGAGEEPSGIALFPPPGTSPPMPGIIVPDDFELPPGYVRHHQVTDDGTLLPPILMFHPDFEWVDAQGRPIELPANHVVPPDLAPPGMPVRMLEVPDTRIEVVEPPPPGADFVPGDGGP